MREVGRGERVRGRRKEQGGVREVYRKGRESQREEEGGVREVGRGERVRGRRKEQEE